MITVSEARAHAVAETARRSGRLEGRLWEQAFEEGRLAALDELQDRFCVCMK